MQFSLDKRQHGWHIPDGMKIAFRFYSFPQAGSNGQGESWSEFGILYLAFMQESHKCNRKCLSPKPNMTRFFWFSLRHKMAKLEHGAWS